jgi:hypothetical protein
MNEEIRWMKTKDLQADPVVYELSNSEAMRPYMNYYDAVLRNDVQSTQNASAALKDMPVEKRYIWGVISTQKWALADFDSSTVKLDLPHIPEARKREMVEEMEIRALQVATLLKTLKGE